MATNLKTINKDSNPNKQALVGLARFEPEPKNMDELRKWLSKNLNLQPYLRKKLLDSVDSVLRVNEQIMEQVKKEELNRVSAEFAKTISRKEKELEEAKLAYKNDLERQSNRKINTMVRVMNENRQDRMTKLMNASEFFDRLERYLKLERRSRWCAVGVADMTSLKWYNDNLGHRTGNMIIRRVARLLEKSMRPECWPTRMGGDEFCFIIPMLNDYNDAYPIAERFRNAVQNYNWVSKNKRISEQPVMIDVGVACLRTGSPESRQVIPPKRLADELLHHADIFMYRAKRAHLGHVYIASVKIKNRKLVEIKERRTD